MIPDVDTLLGAYVRTTSALVGPKVSRALSDILTQTIPAIVRVKKKSP